MNIIKIRLTLSDFVTTCLWLLTLKDRLRTRLLRFTTTDSRMTDLLTLWEQSDLPTCNGLVWWPILFTIWTFRLRSLQELIDLLTFNGLTCWLTILALLILVLLTIVGQTGLLTVNSSASLLTLLTLQAFCLLTLLEHTPLTGLHWYKRFTFPRTLDKITIHLAMTWLLQFPDLETGRPTLVNWGKSSSLKEKEIVPGMDYLETSLYNVLRIFNEKFIWLFCAVNVATIDFSSLTFPCTTRCMESL